VELQQQRQIRANLLPRQRRPLYYYSFTDAYIAMAYKSLTKEQQARFDPMITGFNPADMYAADHIKRVLLTFPGYLPVSVNFPFTKNLSLRKLRVP
jgi:hypothetical protein